MTDIYIDRTLKGFAKKPIIMGVCQVTMHFSSDDVERLLIDQKTFTTNDLYKMDKCQIKISLL